MNRRFTMCVALFVFALIGVWTVHSIGQDLFDSPPADDIAATDDSSDDLFADDAADESSDGLFADDASDDNVGFDDEPNDETLDDLLDSGDAAGDLFDSGTDDNDQVLGLDLDLEAEEDVDLQLGDITNNKDLNDDFSIADEEMNVVFPDMGHNASRRRGIDYALGAADARNAAGQARQRLSQLQQTILQHYMQTKNKPARDRLVDQLTKAVSGEFDVRQQARGKELKALEQELNRLRSIHQQREREKNTIVRTRVRQLIRDKEGLGWGSDSVSRRFR